MKVQILGTGCPRCKQLLANAQEAAAGMGEVEIEKVEDLQEIMKYRVLSTPALVIDGNVKCAGRVPNPNEIKSWLEAGR